MKWEVCVKVYYLFLIWKYNKYHLLKKVSFINQIWMQFWIKCWLYFWWSIAGFSILYQWTINGYYLDYYSVQFSSVTQSCPTLCDPMSRSTPGLPVHLQLLEFDQTHVHWVGDGIQPSQPLSSSSPPALHLSQNQGLFQWVSSSYQVAKLLEFQLQHQSFQWTPRADLFQDGLDRSPCRPRDSEEYSPAPQFKINSSVLNFPYCSTLSSIHDYCLD